MRRDKLMLVRRKRVFEGIAGKCTPDFRLQSENSNAWTWVDVLFLMRIVFVKQLVE